MKRHWLKALSTAASIMIALAMVAAPQQAWGQQKKDDKAVLDEVLDILREKGQITEEKYRELKDRAQKEGPARSWPASRAGPHTSSRQTASTRSSSTGD